MSAADRRRAELQFEKSQLDRTEAEIKLGRNRLQNQQELLVGLRARGSDTRQAERLADLLDQTLLQWELHRALIAERISYLEQSSNDRPVQSKE